MNFHYPKITIYDYFSYVPLFYLAFVLIQIYDPFYRWLCILAITLSALIELFKIASQPWIIRFPQLARPQGATNCNCWNGGGDASGLPGMPSGHVALICFLLVSIFVHGLRTQSNPILLTILALYAMVQIYFVALSRLKKRCHTELQVAVGAAIGVSCAMLFAIVAP